MALEKFKFGQVSPDESERNVAYERGEGDTYDKKIRIATNRIQARNLGVIEEATPEELKADQQRVFMMMHSLWGAAGRIRLYEESFDTTSRMGELLPEIEENIEALQNASDLEMEIEGQTVLKTLQRLARIRDHIKMALLK